MELEISDFNSVWVDAWGVFSTRLTADEEKLIKKVASATDLKHQVQTIKEAYSKSTIPKLLGRADHFITHVQSLSHIINTYVQAKPEIAALVWGSIALVLELAARHNRTLELIVDTWEEMDHALPRFQVYIDIFGVTQAAASMRRAIVCYYDEVIKQCQDFISFLKTNPIRNLFWSGKASRKLSRTSGDRFAKLRRLKDWVDDESHAVGLRTLKELSDMVTKAPASRSMRLPYACLPFAKNERFFKRQGELAALHEALEPHPGGVPTISRASLWGSAGHGKTQIALQFAHRLAHQYDAVLWIPAESNLKLFKSVKEHAKEMGLLDGCKEYQDDQVMSIFNRQLAASSRGNHPVKWLLILDNVDDEDTLRLIRPTGGQGAILITTRSPSLARAHASRPIQVPLFTAEESAEFLADIPEPLHGAEEQVAREEICTRLGHLPLALDLIRYHCSSTSSSYQQFLHSHKDFERLLLSRAPSPQWHSEFYSLSIVAAITVRLQKMGHGAQDMMSLLSFLDPDGVPLQIFRVSKVAMLENGPRQAKHLPFLDDWANDKLNDSDSWVLDQALSELIHGSLVTRHRSEDLLYVHRITQGAVVYPMDATHRRAAFEAAILRLNVLFPLQDKLASYFEAWDDCQLYAAQVMALVKAYRTNRKELGLPITLCELVRRCSWYYFEKNHFEQAASMLDTAIEVCRSALSSDEKVGYSKAWYIPRLLSTLFSQRGSVDYETSALGYGSCFFAKAIEVRTAVWERYKKEFDAAALRKFRGNAATGLIAMGRVEEGLQILNRVLEDASAAGTISAEGDITGHANTLKSIALCYHLLGRVPEALPAIEQSIALLTAEFGADSYHVSSALYFQGTIFMRSGNLTDALEAYSKCLRTRDDAQLNHPSSAYIRHKLGVLARTQNQLCQSSTFFNEALRIMVSGQEVLPKAAVRSAWALNEVLVELGDVEEARELRQRVDESLRRHGLAGEAVRQRYSEEFFDGLVHFKWR